MAQDNPLLRGQLLTIVKTYACFPEEAEMFAFINAPNNMQGILDAQTYYGKVPPINTPSYHTGVLFFGSWHDFCDREPMGKFFQFAKLSVKYPSYPANDQSNCQKIKDALVSLKSGLANVTENNADVKKSIVSAYNDKIAEYSNQYTNMTCDTYLANQAKAQAATQAVSNALNVVSGGNPILKWAIGGGVLVIGFMVIKRLINGKTK